MRRSLLTLLVAAPLLLGQQKKILVTGLTDQVAKELQSVVPGARIVSLLPTPAGDYPRLASPMPRTDAEREQFYRELADADAYIGAPRREIIKAGPKLKWVQVTSAGVEPYRYPELLNSDIVITNFQKVASAAIADHAMALLLALTRELTYYIPIRTQEVWGKPQILARDLEGATAVVIGVGGIGSEISKRAWACGMKVIGVDPEDINPSPFLLKTVYPDRLDTVLPEADVVFISAPDTPASHKMMGARQFGLLKKGALFIAVSRGGLYDMDALVAALKEGRLAGAGVDVTDPEPLPKGHPLWRFENVVITPHIATRSQNELRRQLDVVKDNLVRFVNGEPLRYVVDKQKWY
ncbi:MAG: D-2-hydroxyacid dehydrogenase [Bryobacteraceae bacterium]